MTIMNPDRPPRMEAIRRWWRAWQSPPLTMLTLSIAVCIGMSSPVLAQKPGGDATGKPKDQPASKTESTTVPADTPAADSKDKARADEKPEEPAPGKRAKVTSARNAGAIVVGGLAAAPAVQDRLYVTDPQARHVVAELSVLRVMQKKKAVTEVKALREGFTVKSLLKLPVMTASEATMALDRLSLGELTRPRNDQAAYAQRTILGRNPAAALRAVGERVHATMIDAMAGNTYDAQVDHFGVEVALFVPATLGSTWINAIGIAFESLRGESAPLVASRAGVESTAGSPVQELTIEGTRQTVSLIYRPALGIALPSHFLVAMQVLATQTDTATFAGGALPDQTLTASSKGLGATIGLSTTPLEGVELTLDWRLPLKRQLSVTQETAGTATTASGSVTRSAVDFAGIIRFPRVIERHAVAMDLGAGISRRTEQVDAEEVTGSTRVEARDVVPWIKAGVSYVP